MAKYIVLFVCLLAVAVFMAVAIRRGKVTTDQAKGITDKAVDLIREAEIKWADAEKAGADKKAWVMEQLKTAFWYVANTKAIGKLIDYLVAMLNDLDLW